MPSQYDAGFDSDAYLETYFNKDSTSLDVFNKFVEQSFLKLIPIAKEAVDKTRRSPTVFMDLGCGPMIASASVGAMYFDDVYMSDYSTSNRNLIDQWHTTGNLSEHAAAFVKRFEPNFQMEQKDIISNARNKLKSVLFCDINNPAILPNEPGLKFDCISSSFCLECGSTSLSGFQKAVSNVADILKPGGCFAMIGTLALKSYTVADTDYTTVSLTTADVKNAFELANLTILEQDHIDKPHQHAKDDEEAIVAEIAGMFHILGVKK